MFPSNRILAAIAAWAFFCAFSVPSKSAEPTPCPAISPTGLVYSVYNLDQIGGIVFDDACQRIYVTQRTFQTLQVLHFDPAERDNNYQIGLDPMGLDLSPGAGFPNPNLPYTGVGRAYVANHGENTISVINFATSVSTKVALPAPDQRPAYIAVDANGVLLVAADTTPGPVLLQYNPATQLWRNRTADIPGSITSAVLKAGPLRAEITGIASTFGTYKYVAATDSFVAAPLLFSISNGVLTAFDHSRTYQFTTGPTSNGVTTLAVANVATGAVVARTPMDIRPVPNAFTLSADGALVAMISPAGYRVVDTRLSAPVRALALSSVSGISFLRFHNTGATAGVLSITVANSDTGASYGAWSTPSIPPSAELQFSMAQIESDLHIASKPLRYALTLNAPRGYHGTMQHVSVEPHSGLLSNLSTCDPDLQTFGIPARATTNDPYQLSGVHSSLLDGTHPGTVLITSSADPSAAAQQAVLTLYDARFGTRLGRYTSPPIAGKGQLAVSALQLEAAAGVIPVSAPHYVVIMDRTFNGFLQNRVTNRAAKVDSDMSTVCLINSYYQTADPSGAPTSVALHTLNIGSVYSSAQTDTVSLLLLANDRDETGRDGDPKSATVTLTYPGAGGQVTRTWSSPPIPPLGSLQVPIETIERESGPAFTKPAFYTATVTMNFYGSAQHILWRPAAGTLSNFSTCDADGPLRGYSGYNTIAGFHSTLFAGSYPSFLMVSNHYGFPSAQTIEVFEARLGTRLGFFDTPVIGPQGHIIISAAQIEAALGIKASGGLLHYTLSAYLAGSGKRDGALQHLVLNAQTGALEDMTKTCRVFQTDFP